MSMEEKTYRSATDGVWLRARHVCSTAPPTTNSTATIHPLSSAFNYIYSLLLTSNPLSQCQIYFAGSLSVESYSFRNRLDRQLRLSSDQHQTSSVSGLTTRLLLDISLQMMSRLELSWIVHPRVSTLKWRFLATQVASKDRSVRSPEQRIFRAWYNMCPHILALPVVRTNPTVFSDRNPPGYGRRHDEAGVSLGGLALAARHGRCSNGRFGLVRLKSSASSMIYSMLQYP